MVTITGTFTFDMPYIPGYQLVEYPVITLTAPSDYITGHFSDAHDPVDEDGVPDASPGNQRYIEAGETFANGDLLSAFKTYPQVITENADRTTTGSSLITFTVNVACQVMVWHSDNVGRPSWLTDTFTDTAFDVVGKDGSPMSGYERDYAAGATITLGGNTAAGVDDGPMYLVSIMPGYARVPGTPPAGNVQFTSETLSVDEDGTSITVTVERVSGSTGAVGCDVTDGGTGQDAVAGTDYTAFSPASLSWSDGESGNKTFVITITDRAGEQADRTIALDIGNLSGGVEAGDSQAKNVTIIDTDTAAGPRTGIIFTQNFSTFASTITDPEGADESPNDWPVGRTAVIDGGSLRHRDENVYGSDTGKDNYKIISSSPTPAEGSFCAQYIIHDDVDYTVGGYQTRDKPRVDMNFRGVVNSGAITLPYRTTRWIGLAIFLPSDYVSETSTSAREILLQLHSNGFKNNLSLQIGGSASSAKWQLKYSLATVGSSTLILSDETFEEEVITSSHLNRWNYHVLQVDIDNRLTGGSPILNWWLNEALIRGSTNTAFGYDSSVSSFFYPSLNLYKPNYKGAVTGSYGGNKTGSIDISFDSFRIGDETSGYADVHPTQQAEP